MESSLNWYALKVFYNRVFEVEALLKSESVESYIPLKRVVVVHNDGRRESVDKPIINSLMFFRSTLCRAQQLQHKLCNRAFIYCRKDEYARVPLVISDNEMNIFMLVTSCGNNSLEYLGCDEKRFMRGDRVKVIDGDFKGAEGYICRIRKDNRLVVSVTGVCAVATTYIPRCFLEVI